MRRVAELRGEAERGAEGGGAVGGFLAHPALVLFIKVVFLKTLLRKPSMLGLFGIMFLVFLRLLEGKSKQLP